MSKVSKRSAEIKFFHGWAYQPDSWRSWQDRLGASQNVLEFYDRGYFGERRTVAPFSDGEHPKMIIAHSLGLHFVPTEMLKDADWIVLIGSFKEFHTFAEDLGASLATTRAMRNGLKKNAAKVLADFYKQSGELFSRSFEPHPNIARLAEDLHLLDRLHYHPVSHPVAASTLVLHGESDQIVSSRHASVLSFIFPNTLVSVNSLANHALPFTHSDWCLEQLARFCPEVFATEHIEAASHAG